MDVGSYLASLRVARSLSQQDVALRMGVRSRFTLASWEQGRARPSASVLDNYLDAISATSAERLRALELAGEPLEGVHDAGSVDEVGPDAA